MAENLKLSNKVFYVLMSSFLKQFFMLFSGIIVARILVPNDFGIISIGATFTGIVEVFSRIGMEAFFLSRKEVSAKGTNTIYFINLFIGFVLGLTTLCASGLISALYKTPEVKVLLIYSAFSFVAGSFMSIPKSMLLRKMQQNLVSKIEVIQSFLYVVLTLIFALNGFKYLCYAIALLITNILISIIYTISSGFKPNLNFEKKTAKEAFSYTKSFLPKTLLTYIVNNADYAIIGLFLGTVPLGFYYFGFTKAKILTGFMTGIYSYIFFPVFSLVQNDYEKLKDTAISFIEKQSFIIYPFIFIQIIMAKELLTFVFGQQWDGAVFTFIMILSYTFFQINANTFNILFDAVGSPKQNLKFFAIFTPIAILMFYAGTQLGGLYGVSIAVFLANIVGFVILLIRACKFFKWKVAEFMPALLKPAVILAIMTPFAILLKMILNHTSLVDFWIIAIEGLFVAATYLLLLKLLFKKVYTDLISDTKNKIFQKFNKNHFKNAEPILQETDG